MFIPIGGCGCTSLGLGEWSVLSHPSYPIPHAGNETGSVPSSEGPEIQGGICVEIPGRGVVEVKSGKIWWELVW